MLPRVVCLFALVAVTVATDVKQCKGRSIPDLAENVQLTPCHKPPCKLRKGTDQHITIKFKPENDLKELTNEVKAEIGLGFPVPFVGVDGKSVCNKIENEAGGKVSCPLKAGETYVYKDSFPVLSIYPSIQVRVHWALLNEGKDVVCFEVPAKII